MRFERDADSNLFDVLVAAANNPRSLAYDAIRNFGTMALPTGAALGAGKLAQAAPALARYVPALERVAPWRWRTMPGKSAQERPWRPMRS